MKKMCEINGVRYVTPSVFGNAINWNRQKVTAACEDGRIIGANKDTSGNWIIPVNARKPLEIEQIRELMVSTVYLKNKPNYILGQIDHKNVIGLYTYLQQTGYIEPFDTDSDRIPYEVLLTDKGIKLATQGRPLTINWMNIGKDVIQVAAAVLTIIQVV